MTVERWNRDSLDPNHPDVIKNRIEALRAARREMVSSRIAYLKSVVHGKRVLDVGVVAHVVDAADGSDWLHGIIAKEASYSLGVDILEEPVATLRARGFNVLACDITANPPAVQETFDVMLCGEVIEHLDSPGGMFSAAQRLLVPGGRLVLTSPNPYYMGRVARYLKDNPYDSVDHVFLAFPGGIAEMAQRHGLVLEQYRGVKVAEYKRLNGKLFHSLFSLLRASGVVPEAECETMIYECVKPLP